MGHRPKLVGKRIAGAAILAAAAVSLGLSVRHGILFTAHFGTPAQINSSTMSTRRLECIYEDVREQVPQGVTAYVHGPSQAFTWELAEASTPWLIPQQVRPLTTSWRLYLVAVPDDAQCQGMALEVEHL
jgi:hypothetical protein